MSNPVDGTPGLVVPIDVVAFCVGSTDPQRTARFAGATVNYNLFLNQEAAAFLGGNVTRGFQDTLEALEPGVHLHWALPDALTRAEGPGLNFPAVPNRWLVTRLVIDGGRLTPASFIVESDTLAPSSGQSGALVVPVKPAADAAAGGPPVGFEFLGRALPLERWLPAPSAGRSLADGTGFELTAVSNGVPSFAAYYPEGRNSFGFYDPLAQLPASALLMYVVTGWYQSPANDPAQRVHLGSNGQRTLAESHDWLCEGSETYTLYSGSVQQVGWSAGSAYVPDNPTPISADAVIGNTPAEALAAWFANSMQLGPLAEQMLTALQQGAWERLSQASEPLLAQLRERLHESQFSRIDAGSLYTLHRQAGGGEEEAIDLPIGIARALDAANLAADSLLAVENQTGQLRWQVFADWYRYFAAGSDPAAAAEQAAIFNHFGQTLMPLWDPGLKQAQQQAEADLQAKLAALNRLLESRPDLSLRTEPGPRYFRPSDPALLLRSGDLARPARYGGDNDHHPQGKLLARPTGALVAAVQIGPAQRTAADFAAAAALPPSKLPYAADCSALIAEAILLNADVASSWSGQSRETLAAALAALLAGQGGAPWAVTVGTPPSPVAMNLWSGNPWLPLFLTWEAGFAPLHPTLTAGALTDYDPAVIRANFTIDPATGSFLSYTPGGAGAIPVDPARADYSAGYSDGWSLLSGRPAENLRAQIDAWLAKQPDPTLQQIRAALDRSSFLVQPIAGFTDRLLNRNALMQVSLVVTPGMGTQDAQLTTAAAEVLATGAGPVTYHTTPLFGEPFNPLRAGWLSFGALGLTAVDAFGQRRPVQFGATYAATSMAALPPGGGAAEAGYLYAAPRIAQASRLLFQWLAATDGACVEFNDHPAQSPICGWLLPDHLNGGFFFYDAGGRPLGSLFPAGDDSGSGGRIVWQGAPGADGDIDSPLIGDPVVAAAHPQLRALILQLGTVASSADFQAFYAAVDAAHGSINPGNPATDAGLTVLVGRPVALVQAALTLELKGPPCLNQNRACMNADDPSNPYWVDSDAGLSNVQFPVVLGDLADPEDGLVGFFIGNPAGGYQLGRFYSEAAAAGARGAVVRPEQGTLLLTPTPAAAGAPPAAPLRLLMLVDPRAPVHALSGILPTRTLRVPPELASAAMGDLEISLPIAPVLRAQGGLALPAPDEAGFELSYLEQRATAGQKRWYTLPGITPAVAKAIWSYTPQTLTEGWLRLNPALLQAALLNDRGQPLAQGGQLQGLTLRIANRQRSPITFAPGQAVPEGGPASGSIFYIHFGALVAPADLAGVQLAADGWSFTAESDAIYGGYFAATRATPLTLGPAGGGAEPDSFDIAITALKAATGIAQAQLQIDYYRLDGIADGVATAVVTVAAATHTQRP